MHAEKRKEKKSRTCRDKEIEESPGIDDKIQMLCERLSTTKCSKDEKRVNRKTSKV